MSRVTFKFKNGKERAMSSVVANILTRRGMGTYMTRDLVADRTPPKVATTEPDVDSAGDAWNPDLHVASKLKNMNGTWRKKPGAAAAQESAE
jgi:hypothetical protein